MKKNYYAEKRFTLECRHPLCSRAATHELKTSGTASYGFYCKRHVDAEVKRRNEEEARE